MALMCGSGALGCGIDARSVGTPSSAGDGGGGSAGVESGLDGGSGSGGGSGSAGASGTSGSGGTGGDEDGCALGRTLVAGVCLPVAPPRLIAPGSRPTHR